jgi:hypothetical protein
MNGGVKFLSCSALLVVAACGGEDGKLQVRAIPTPLAQGKKPVSFRVAEANAQMALGNVALALEAYRKAVREDPTSIDALAGIAACYDRMGRFDLSRRHYEAALALEPNNETILAMLAASLDQQGRSSEAALVRNEIRQRSAGVASGPAVDPTEIALAAAPVPAPAAPVAAAPAVNPPLATVAELAMPTPQAAPLPAIAATPLAASRGTIVPIAVVAAFAPDEVPAPAAVSVVPPKPLAKAAAVTPKAATIAELAVPRPQATPLPALAAVPLAASIGVIAPAAVIAAFAPNDEPTPAPAPAAQPKPVALADGAAPARSVTITLPPPRPVTAPIAAIAPTAANAPAPAAPAAPAPAPVEGPVGVAYVPPAVEAASPAARQAIAAGPAPKLERLSLGEVALVTPGAPRWASLVVKQDQRSATLRFVPLRQAGTRLASVRLLNAARVEGLAARTRSTLLDRGWRGIAIGDAGAARAQSLVLYPAHRRTTALSLARQFGFKAAQRASGREITVLLGRDAALVARRSPAA